MAWRPGVAWLTVGLLACRAVRTLARRAVCGDALQALGARAQQLKLLTLDGETVHRAGKGPAPRLDEDSTPANLADEAVPLPTIDEVVRDLATKQARLSQYIESCLEAGVDVAGLTRLFALHGQNASRLGRLLRDRLALGRAGGSAGDAAGSSGDAADTISEAIGLSLDALEQELGVAL